MKKFFALLLSAGMLFGFTACGDDSKDGNGDGPIDGGSFSCKITTVVDGTSVDVTVTPSKGFETTPYKIWVVKKADYAASVPSTAVDATGTVTKIFDGLAADETYYAVASDGDKVFKTKEFITEPAGPREGAIELEGSDFYVLSMDTETFEKIKSKVVADLRSDGLSTFIDIWEYEQGHLAPGTPTGPNAYGLATGWTAFTVTPNPPSTWFGAAWRLINPKPADISNIDPLPAGKVTQAAYDEAQARRTKLAGIKTTDGLYLHLYMKTNAAGNFSIAMFNSGDDKIAGHVKVSIGDENATYGFKRDGAWHPIEIPLDTFLASAAFDINGVNAFSITQDGTPFPKEINIDGMMIYKPKK